MSVKLPSASPSPTLLASVQGGPQAMSASGFQMSKLKCRVHPSVILTMLDAHDRLNEGDEFAIGTLLGTITSEGSAKGRSAPSTISSVSKHPESGAANATSSRTTAPEGSGAAGSSGAMPANSGASRGGSSRGTTVVVEVIDCFANSYHWDAGRQILQIQKEPHEWMLKLREKVNPRLAVVGWCCTTNNVVIVGALSEWPRSDPKTSRFVPSKALPDPIQIIIDASLAKGAVLSQTKAYIRSPLRQLLHEMPLEMSINPADAAGAAAIVKASALGETGADKKAAVETLASRDFLHSSEDLVTALRKLKTLIGPCITYVQQVLSGERVGDPDIGRTMMRSVCLDTLLASPKDVAALCESALQDNLMIAYLSSLVQLQFTVAEKLNTSLSWS